jgi:hypothetical protein
MLLGAASACAGAAVIARPSSTAAFDRLKARVAIDIHENMLGDPSQDVM